MHRKILAALLGLAGLLLGGGSARAVCPVIPFVFAQGSTWNASQVNANFTSLYNCASAPSSLPFVLNTVALQALAPNAYPFVYREYDVTPGDGGSTWYWDNASTCTNDGLTCVTPSSAPANGRWLLDPLWPSLKYRNNTSVSGLVSPLIGALGGYAQNLMTLHDTGHTTEVAPPYAPPIIGLESDIITGGVENSDTTHVGMVGYSAITSDNTATGGKQEYWQGGFFIAGGNASAGGTLGAERGIAWGAASNVSLYPPADHWYAAIAHEFDVQVTAGVNVVHRLGVWVGDISGAQGSGAVDCGLCIGSGSASPGFKNGIQFTSFAGGGQNATDNLMYSDHLLNVTNILNLSNVGCTGAAALSFNNGTGIGCDGDIFSTFGSLTYSGLAGAFVIQNARDATFDLVANAGAGATQTVSLSFADNNVRKWSILKDATTHNFRITNLVTTDSIVAATTAGVAVFGEPNGGTGSQLSLNRAGGAQFLALPTVAAGTGKRFLCIDTATKLIYEGSGVSCN